MFRIHYEHCDISWDDTWDCACNDHCPACGHEVEPVRYEEIDETDEEVEVCHYAC